MESIVGLLRVVALILMIITLVRAVKLARKKEGVSKKSVLTTFGAALALMILAGILAPVDEHNTEIAEEKQAEEVASGSTYDIASKDGVERLLNDLLGDTTNTDNKRVESVIFNDLEGVDFIGMHLVADENMTAKLAKKGMLKNTVEIMAALKGEGYDGNISVLWKLPLADKHGNESLEKVLVIDVEASDFNKINYDNFDYNDLPDIASDYFEHPGFGQ